MIDDRAERAVRNNAIWCETICRLHGHGGEFQKSLWLNRHRVPPFYPNAVTLNAADGTADQLAGIRELLATSVPGAWSVKDSFRALDLGPLGFEALFDAVWIYRAASAAAQDHLPAGVRWARVEDELALADWEHQWGGDARTAAEAPRIFLPQLLSDADVAVLAAYRGPTIVGGVIANRAAGVVGLSNTFHPKGQGVVFWAGFATAAERTFPGLPLVGYGSAEAIGDPRTAGFEPLALLRIWVKSR